MKTAPAAVSPDAVRDFLRQAAELGTWSTADAARFLGVPAAAARQTLATLTTVGYIETVPRARDRWRNTEAGNAVAKVSKARAIKRDTAADKLDEFLHRCQKVNEEPQYLYRVVRAVVYGPYLVRTAAIRNIDIAVELAPKEKNKARHEEKMRARGEAAAGGGKRFASHAARREWGRTEVLEFLKARTRTLEIVELTDWILSQPHQDLLS